MNIRRLSGVCKIIGGFLLAILTVMSCKRLPRPDFTYAPMDNPEAGDTIQFTNLSEESTSFQWEFGDGNSSVEENPSYVYKRAGIVDIKLTAYNEEGEEAKTETVTMNQPTVLGFFVYDSIGMDSLPGALVLVYDNDYDRDFKPDEALFGGITDNNGIVLFENVEPIVYYINAIKEESEGTWYFPGQTPTAIEQNEVNLYNVRCVWIENQKKATLSLESVIKDYGSRPPTLLKRISD